MIATGSLGKRLRKRMMSCFKVGNSLLSKPCSALTISKTTPSGACLSLSMLSISLLQTVVALSSVRVIISIFNNDCNMA